MKKLIITLLINSSFELKEYLDESLLSKFLQSIHG